MKITSIGAACAFALLAGTTTSQAQVAYPNSALNGCYAHLSTSVDSGSGTAKDVVGTFCFDGNCNILGTTGTPGLSGSMGNVNGKAGTASDQTGTYSITNSPGDGMGTFTIGCDTHAFAIKNVDKTGLAHGMSFILIKRTGKCKSSGVELIGGSAEYQGPTN